MEQFANARNAFSALPAGARRAIMAVTAGTVLVIAFVVIASMHTNWQVVESGIKPQDAYTAQSALTTAGIQNQLGQGGTAIEVPASKVSDARAQLAQAGALSGSGGEDPYKQVNLDKTPTYGMTSDQAAIVKQRLVETKIQDDIQNLNGIASAQVTVVQPAQSPFSDDQTDPTASVTVDTDGSGLSSQQVRAITQLTAFSVEGLKPADVNVVDEQGNSYTGGSSDSAGDSGSSTLSASQAKLRIEAQYDNSVEQDLSKLLTPIVGKGNFVVASNASIDLDKETQEIKTFGGPKHQQGPANAIDKSDETLNGGGAAAAAEGVAGTASNATNPTGNTNTPNKYGSTTGNTGNGNGDYKNTTDKETFDNDEIRRMVNLAPGNVTHQGITVMVDSKGLSGAEKDSIKAVVAGYATKASDEATVKFGKLAAAHPKKTKAKNSMLQYLAPSTLKYVAAAFGILFLLYFVRKQLRARTSELLMAPREPLLLESGQVEPIPLKELEAAMTAAGTFEHAKRQELQSKVEQIARDKPQDVAVQLRGWLHDDRGRR